MGVVDNEIFSNQTESIDHRLFKCAFSSQCAEVIRGWFGVSREINTLQDMHRKRRMPKPKLRLVQAIFGNLVYAIWNVRNEAVW